MGVGVGVGVGVCLCVCVHSRPLHNASDQSNDLQEHNTCVHQPNFASAHAASGEMMINRKTLNHIQLPTEASGAIR